MALVELAVDDRHVALATLNDPESRNALSPTMKAELIEALQRLDADPEVRCIVIAGSAKSFAAGADIRSLAAQPLGAPPEAERRRILDGAERDRDADGGGGRRLRARRRLRAGDVLRPDRRRREDPLRPARGDARADPRRRWHPAPDPGDREAQGDGVRARPGASSTPRRRRAGAWSRRPSARAPGWRRRWSSRTRSPPGPRSRPGSPSARCGRPRRPASAPASRPSANSSSRRWRPRTGSRAPTPSSRSASPTSKGAEAGGAQVLPCSSASRNISSSG